MTKPEARKGGGAKTTRSETVTVRLDPRLRYLAEVAAKVQRRTLSSYIESAVEQSLQGVYLNQEAGVSVADAARQLWFLGEPARLARLHQLYPHLLDITEQRLNRAAAQAHKLVGTAGNRDEEDVSDELRPYWDFLKQCAVDDVPMDQVMSAVMEMKRDIDGFGPVTKERIAAARKKAEDEFKKKMAFIEDAEKNAGLGES